MKIISLIIVLLLFVTPMAYGWDIKLAWDAPTLNDDGTPLTDLGGYKLYRSITAGDYSIADMVDVGNVLTYTLPITQPGTFYFVGTAYDTVGNESIYSNEISAVITQEQLDKPSPPINITAEGVPTKPVIIFNNTVIIGTP